MNKQCIQMKNLTKSFSGRKVINDLSFEVNKGEVFALLGHNGAGKSTTIDLILGLKSPDEGNATILGMDAAKHRKKVFEKVGVQLQHTYFPMLLFSGATIPAEVFPAGVRTVIKWMPLGIGIDTLKKVSIGCFDDIMSARESTCLHD